MQLQGIAAIVAGGAMGLGGATAELLAKNGAKVTIFDMNVEAGTAHAQKIGGAFVQVNVTDEASVNAGLDDVEKRLGGPARILVNTAGIAPAERTANKEGKPHSLDMFRKVLEVNLIGSFNTMSKFAGRLAKASLIDEERGVVVNTASIAAFEGQIGQAAYSASKGGICGLTVVCARDLAALAIRVNTVAPGLFLTPMMMGLPETVRQGLGSLMPFPSRLGKPEEYAMLVESIIRNPMLNGEIIRLDGAARLPPR